ncbi:MarR family winged helix-turn-helix transcriptional regulator [Sphingosinicella sp. CPCC 101087]|uniref:MarR family winged helix-turn-helix transcriptional regulator n=1 Tax=Sphingosinicella sp. CPCC 101087 TaxID=2497754 RepID=UPI00101B6597|nr:MarR family winged helix-turn-helix transcriptional regulator [Sphingosinicella sp. CPCC 101087]
MAKDRTEVAREILRVLYARPGFLIRRAHQITEGLFADMAGSLNITPTQFGALTVVSALEPIDQISLARALGLDRSTTGLVVANLESRGLITRTTDPGDRRRRVLATTAEGRDMLQRITVVAREVQDVTLEIFDEQERRTFLALLAKLVDRFNASVRTPLITDPAELS